MAMLFVRIFGIKVLLQELCLSSHLAHPFPSLAKNFYSFLSSLHQGASVLQSLHWFINHTSIILLDKDDLPQEEAFLPFGAHLSKVFLLA